MTVTHFPFDLRPGGQRGHRVNDDDVYRTGADKHVGNLQRLLACIWLRHQKVRHVNAQSFGILRVEGVFGVNERRCAAEFLSLGNDMQRERGLS